MLKLKPRLMIRQIAIKNKLQYMLSIAAFTFLVACEPSLKITTDYDRAVSFSQFKTFAVVTIQGANQSISQLNVDRINKAIRAEMTKKGFQETAENPDIKVNAVTILKDKQAVTANTDYYGYGGSYRPYSWNTGATGYTTYNVYDYIDGSLIIEIVDAKTNKLVWEGIGNKEIDGPIRDADTKIPAAVAKIMQNFPPGAVPAK
jgi:hypothetical protein